jgi:hypothetical protein
MKASLRRIECITAARTLLDAAEDRFSRSSVKTSSKEGERPAFQFPAAFSCDFPELSASMLDREWKLAEPRYVLSPSLRAHKHVRTAVHEAGHFIVALQILREGSRISAHQDGKGNGSCTWDGSLRPEVPDKIGRAAFAHAGAMAELVLSGEPWAGPIRHGNLHDWRQADALLTGRKSPAGAHAFAQVYALTMIAHRWDHLQTVARALYEKGRYTEEVTK